VPAGSKVAVAEENLKASARKKGMKGRRAARYVYGALNNSGLMRGNKPTRRGMAAAHQPVSQTATDY